MNHRVIIFATTIFFVLFCSCSKNEPKEFFEAREYFVRPCDFLCDYPFNDTTKFAITCRVWGLLKYFHPNVATDLFLDWDQILLDRLEFINCATTPEQVNTELMQMIRIAGEYTYLNNSTWDDSLNMNVNLCWLENSFINDTIRQTLREIASLTSIVPSRYITIRKGGGTDMYFPYPEEYLYHNDYTILQYEYRLLALFRFWNVIYYLYPYKYLMDQSWDVTLSEFIPYFINSNDELTYRKVVVQLATRLNDGHAFTNVTPPFDRYKFKYIAFIDSSTVIRTSLEGSLLERGDIILSIDGKSIRDIRDSIAAFIPSSNKRYTDNAVNGCIFNSIMDSCIITVMRNQQIMTFREGKKTLPKEMESSHFFHNISSDIGYVNLELIKESDIPVLMDTINPFGGIIFDLRNYPRNTGDLLFNLIQTRSLHYASAIYVDFSRLGAFYKQECIINLPDELWKGRKTYKGKIVFLINELTMSMAETMAMILRSNGIILVGTPTAGANGGVHFFRLPGNITVYYPLYGLYYPDGEEVQRKGIVPDIEVYPTMDDVMAGRDEVLEAAITFLNSN